MQNARDAIANAVTAEPNLAEVQTALGNFNFWLGWDWSAAEAAYRRAIGFDPNLPLAHRMLGVVLSHSCRHDEARSSMQRARELDPLYVMHQSLSSHIAFDARDFTTALHFARQALVVDPDFWIAQLHLAQVAVELGDYDLALDALVPNGEWSSTIFAYNPNFPRPIPPASQPDRRSWSRRWSPRSSTPTSMVPATRAQCLAAPALVASPAEKSRRSEMPSVGSAVRVSHPDAKFPRKSDITASNKDLMF